MKKQKFLKGALLLTTLSVIAFNVYFVASKNASRLNIGSFNIEALTGVSDEQNSSEYGPSHPYYYEECDQRYIVYYIIKDNKKRLIDTQVGANVEIPYKSLMDIGASASFNANWNKINENEIVLQKSGGKKLAPNTYAHSCEGVSGPCNSVDPCRDLEESSNKSLNEFLSSLSNL